MTVLFQCKLWLLPALFISQSPTHHRVYRDARSQDRERGLSKLSGVDVLYMFILCDPIGSFSDWQRYGPARALSGAPLFWCCLDCNFSEDRFARNNLCVAWHLKYHGLPVIEYIWRWPQKYKQCSACIAVSTLFYFSSCGTELRKCVGVHSWIW